MSRLVKKSLFSIRSAIKDQVIFSIAISGVLLAIIIVINFAFDLFKGFGGFSIQMFLVVYSVGIYLIPNILVSLFFLLITPPILFALENGPYIITPMQVFIEYFLVFYVFILMWFARFINNKIINKYVLNPKKAILYEIVLIVFFYVICIVIKFIFHSLASYLYWELTWLGSLSYNALGSLANSAITIPFLIVTIPVFIYLRDKHYYENLSKW